MSNAYVMHTYKTEQKGKRKDKGGHTYAAMNLIHDLPVDCSRTSDDHAIWLIVRECIETDQSKIKYHSINSPVITDVSSNIILLNCSERGRGRGRGRGKGSRAGEGRLGEGRREGYERWVGTNEQQREKDICSLGGV